MPDGYGTVTNRRSLGEYTLMRTIGFAIAGAILMGVAAPASATVLTATYQGLTGSVSDPAGLFGAGAASGQFFTLTFTFDTSKGSDSTTGVPGQGSASFNGSGGETATLSFNNLSQSITDDEANFFQGSFGNIFGITGVQSIAESAADGETYAEIFRNADPAVPFTYKTPFSNNINDGNGSSDGQFLKGEALIFLNPTTFTLAVVDNGTVSPIPLPASLPLFAAAVIGLGVAGLSLKRRTDAL